MATSLSQSSIFTARRKGRKEEFDWAKNLIGAEGNIKAYGPFSNDKSRPYALSPIQVSLDLPCVSFAPFASLR
jgi:hypothetical protein